MGVIHRDISPDNIILQTSDKLPVLIDFGGVKETATKVVSESAHQENSIPLPTTRLGKVGSAPDEQMQQGVIHPNSDLYVLAVTVLVLLTGKEPSLLIDTNNLTFNWRLEVSLSQKLGHVLDQMLAPQPRAPFPTARQVIAARENISTLTTTTQAQPITAGGISNVTGCAWVELEILVMINL